MCLWCAVTKRRHKLLAEVLFDVCGWKAASPFPRRFLRHCSLKVSFFVSFPSSWLKTTHLSNTVKIKILCCCCCFRFSAEWLKADTRRTAVGLDFDLEALEWCMDNNISKLGADVYSRMSLLHGNVLTPLDAKHVTSKSHELIQNISLDDEGDDDKEDLADDPGVESDSLPKRDIVCAFNFSCCCLHKRSELVTYFENAREALSKKGGIFVMDLYGGASAEGQLKLQRKFPTFTVKIKES